MGVKTIFNPLLEEGFQKLADVSNTAWVQEDTLTVATATTLSDSKTIPTDSVLSFITRLTAIKTSTGDVWCHEFRGAIKNLSGTTTIVDTVTNEYIAEDVATSGYSATVGAVGTVMDIKVTSGDALQIKWKAETVFSEITF